MHVLQRRAPAGRSCFQLRHIPYAVLAALIALAAKGWADAKTSPTKQTSSSPSAPALLVAQTPVSLEQLQLYVDRSAPPRLRSHEQLANWVREELSPQLRLTHHARATLPQDARYRTLYNEALTQALEQFLLTRATNNPPAPDRVEAYFREHSDRFQQPESILVWRMLVPTEKQANDFRQQVVDSKKATETWKRLVREHSVDLATRQRGGSLGFVQADGRTDVPQVRVARVVHETAAQLRDGQLAQAPVKEGDYWALVWRRGTRPAKTISLQQARAEIEQQLVFHQARVSRLRLIERLRGERLQEYTPDLLEAIDYSAEPGSPSARISTIAKAAEDNPQPKETDLGER